MSKRAGTPTQLRKAAASEAARRAQEPGSVLVFFKEPQSKPRFWERMTEEHHMRAYHNARYEIRSTSTVTLLAIVQQSQAGIVEFVYDMADVEKFSALPHIDLPEPEAA